MTTVTGDRADAGSGRTALQIGSLTEVGATRVETIIEALRDRGERITTARRALLSALDQAPDHRSADELAAEVSRLYPEIHRATIYRTLDTLTRLQVIEHSHLGHGPAVYHLADRVHQHLVCEHCGAVTEVPPSALKTMERTLKRDYGFTVKSRHFAVVGLCQQCDQEAAESSALTTNRPT